MEAIISWVEVFLRKMSIKIHWDLVSFFSFAQKKDKMQSCICFSRSYIENKNSSFNFQENWYHITTIQYTYDTIQFISNAKNNVEISRGPVFYFTIGVLGRIEIAPLNVLEPPGRHPLCIWPFRGYYYSTVQTV